ncbi:MAG TPA: GGDEF domain-containing protein [Burkholderiales bacterium]|jgi:diguanylate cyclase (GGDEF)-like protein|nr:GGDEF domain-containing protein [Burkholderiales bacterium]
MAALLETTVTRSAGEPKAAAPVSFEQEELRGISRTVAEIHWLLLVLVLLYQLFAGSSDAESAAAVSSGLFFYAALVMSFRYANFYRRETRWKIAIETVGMIAFVTWVLWFAGRLSSPLLNAYLLPVITSALTLGKPTTLVNVGLIAACYLLLGGGVDARELASLRFAAGFAVQVAPVLLVAYITTMFSADIRYGLQRAKLLSETDDLTGLLNTRGFAIAANRLFGQAARYDRASSVLMIDSDNLKRVNDSYGHEAGNRLLRQLASAIQAELRATDVPARYGGDEFIVLLPETPAKGALDVAERIRAAIARMPLATEGTSVVASVSVGVACFPEDGRTLDTLAARADRALYEAKQRGRNCVVRYLPR